MHYVVADTAEFIEALDKGHTIQRPGSGGGGVGEWGGALGTQICKVINC